MPRTRDAPAFGNAPRRLPDSFHCWWVRPNNRFARVEQCDYVCGSGPKPLGNSLRSTVVGRNQRDQMTHVPFLARPVTYCTRCLSGVACSPVRPRERPPQLRLGVAARLRKCRVRPTARVPDQKPGTADEASVTASFDHERPDVIFVPAPQPLGYDIGNMLTWHNLTTEELHYRRIGKQLGCCILIVESGKAQSQTFSLEDVAATPASIRPRRHASKIRHV
jgi:hypothetical protein